MKKYPLSICDTDISLSREKSCPIPNTHRRLEEVHQLWHQTAAAYHDPVRFRINLNAAIQALRNVTFVLQKEKHLIPNFDKWYEGWRQRLRNDRALNWLHQARNVIVKEGDLETDSIAIVTLINWLDFPVAKLKVPPFASAVQIAKIIERKNILKLPEKIREEAVLVVERKWVASELPDEELLDVLARVYGFFSEMISEAHQLCGSDMLTFDREKGTVVSVTTHMSGRLPCMIVTMDIRRSYFHLKEHVPLKSDLEFVKLDEKMGRKAAKRYNLRSISKPHASESRDIYKIAEWFNDVAKQILVKDKYHSGLVILMLPNGNPQFIACNTPDQQGKYVLYRMIADEVDRSGADGVIFINEVWYSPEGESGATRPSLSPNREEALTVSVASSDGRNRLYVTPFTRGPLGGIRVQPTQILENQTMFFLEPIYTVWRRRKIK
jgi:hypothetical protein